MDYDPPKLTVVIDSATKTRELVEKSGLLGIQVPNFAQVDITQKLGTTSLSDSADKILQSGAELFYFDGHEVPFVKGCSAWLSCKVIPERRNQDTYDLFIAEIVGAWADTRVFREGHWNFESADNSLRSLHHIAGGNYYLIGEPVRAGNNNTGSPNT